MEEESKSLTINKETVDVLIANVIPTTKYFESRFDLIQVQITHIEKQNEQLRIDMDNKFEAMRKDVNGRFEQVDKRFEQVDFDIHNLEDRMNKRFEQVDKRFEQVDKRFEQVDKRFEQVDKRFEQIDKRFEQVDKRFESLEIKFDKLIERIDVRIETGLMENRTLLLEGLKENRAFTLRLFTFAMTFAAISVVGLAGRIFGLF